MKAPRFLVVLMLLAVPLASAGGADVSVRYLETGQECSSDSSSNEYSGNHTFPDGTEMVYRNAYSSSGWGCTTSVDTLAVDVAHNGTSVASARVGGADSWDQREDRYESWMTQSGPYGTNTNYHSGSSWTSADSERRGVDATALGQSAFVGRSCENMQSHGWSQGQTWSPYGNSSYGGSHESSHSGCRIGGGTGATAAGLDSDCRSSGSSTSYAWSDGYGTSGQSWGDCFTGVRGGAAGESLSAGTSASCRDSSSKYADPYHDYRSSSSTCRDGVVVYAPGQTTLFVGRANFSEEGCTQDDCSTSAWSIVGISFGSPHSPVSEIGLYAPLP